jgi:cytochrome c oxidase cbb3-type subunit 4
MDYFKTDWAAMTLNDWIGMILTVVIFLLMVWAYVHVFHPKNKDKLESQRYLPDDDDDHIETENRK